MNHVRPFLRSAAALLVLLACSGDDVLPPSTYETALNIKVLSGDHQLIALGTVTNPLAVLVTDSKGKPANNITVRWRIEDPDGVVQNVESITDAAGIARVTFAIGGPTGINKITASLLAPFIGSAQFQVVGHVQGATTIAAVASAPNRADTVRSLVPRQVILRDYLDRPVRGVVVSWVIESGGGALEATQSVTDVNGIAQTVHKLGDMIGVARVRADVPGLTGSPLTFSSTILSGQPASFVKLFGDEQTGIVNKPVANPLSVGLFDAYGNPINGQRVDWTVTSGDGSLTGADLATHQGRAQASHKLGSVEGTQTVSVTTGLPQLQPLTFTSFARAGVIVQMFNYSSYYYYYYGPPVSGYFQPGYQVVSVGDKVIWVWPCRNCTELLHKIVFEDDSTGVYTSPEQYSGEWSRTFTAKGSYRYRCVNHSTDFTHGMAGEIVVID